MDLFSGRDHRTSGPQHARTMRNQTVHGARISNSASTHKTQCFCSSLSLSRNSPYCAFNNLRQNNKLASYCAHSTHGIKIKAPKPARTQKNYADNQSKYKFCTVTTHLLCDDFLGFLWIYSKQTQKTWNIVSTLSLPAFHTANASRILKNLMFPKQIERCKWFTSITNIAVVIKVLHQS